jgi:hypothetical protein
MYNTITVIEIVTDKAHTCTLSPHSTFEEFMYLFYKIYKIYFLEVFKQKL